MAVMAVTTVVTMVTAVTVIRSELRAGKLSAVETREAEAR
jgi:hypothetical protein